MGIRLILLAVFWFLMTGASCEEGEKGIQSPGMTSSGRTFIQGIIAVKGNEPHTWLSLVTEEGIEYRLQGAITETLRNRYQQQSLTLEGTPVKQEPYGQFPIEFKVHNLLSHP